MSATTNLTRRSLSAHKGRSIFIGLAIVLGVAFVSASFVLADSLRSTFDNLFDGLSDGIDLEVRSEVAFGEADEQRDPVPLALIEDIRGVEGVAAATPAITRTVTIIDKDGEAVKTQGAPTLGVGWDDTTGIGGANIREGTSPSGPDQIIMDQSTAERYDFELGDQVEISLNSGRQTFTLVGYMGLGDSKGFAGATVVGWDIPTTQALLETGDGVDAIDLQLVDGADPAVVEERLLQLLPDGTEVVTGEELAEEAQSDVGEFLGFFQNGLLTFAFITLFVSAFIINNVFAITIGQRLRELALMRAVGASGKQVRRLIVAEAFIISALATVVGIVAGIGVSKLMVALFNAGGAGFPATDTILKPRTVIFAVIVGIGVALASVLVPARRAAKVPPVAAMRPELGFAALTSTRRILIGAVVAAIGAAMFLTGIFVSPGGTVGLITLAGLGALLLFLGVASLSTTFARPVSRALGAPIAALLGTPGQLAKENAARAPRRTAATASALMIGVALVSAATVFAESLKATFVETLESAVTADYIITDESFQGLPVAVAEQIAEMPEIDAVTPVRAASMLFPELDDSPRAVAAMDLEDLPKLLDINLQAGSIEAAQVDGILLDSDPAEDLGVTVGDTVPVQFSNGTEVELTVQGIYEDDSVVGGRVISLQTLSTYTEATPIDQFVVARLADTATPDEGRAALDTLTEQFPAVKVQDQAEFRDQQEGQIDQLLVVISVLLVFAIAIAIMGIAITLALSVFERTREIGLMRAIGMTRRQTRRMVRWESVIVTVFGGIVGVVLGTALGIALSTAVPESVIDGVRLPVTRVVFYVFLAAVAGVFAAFYPARKASKMNVLEAIATT